MNHLADYAESTAFPAVLRPKATQVYNVVWILNREAKVWKNDEDYCATLIGSYTTETKTAHTLNVERPTST